jgi:hypothetical protein
MKSNRSIIYGTVMVTIIIILLVTMPVSTALALTEGPNNAGTGTNVGGAGTVDWVEPGAITIPGSPQAMATLNKDNRYSNYLQGTNYSFSIPDNVVITGIEVVINHMSSGNNPSIYDYRVNLVKSGVILTENKASLTPWLKGTFSTTTYGSSTDLWGTTWTPADIEAENFGVALAVYRQNQGNNRRDAIIDSIKITVYYSIVTATTTVDCGTGAAITYGDTILCKATVSDAGVLTPTGTISWTTNGSGSFDQNTCTLAEVTLGIATCEVVYTPSAVGSGAHLITANYGGDVNYNSGSGTDTATVNPKPASVTPNAADKTYGDLDPVFAGTLLGFLDADAVTATYSRIAGETVLGSPYIISATLTPTAVLSNYTITYNTANFTITPKAASVTPNVVSKIYSAPEPLLTGTLSGFLGADGVIATYSRIAGETVLGSPYVISATLTPTAVLSNYNITYNTANFTITPLAASVTPNATSKIYGNPDPALTGTHSGFLGADGVTATYSRTPGETVLGSPYTISATLSPSGVLSNYTITYNTSNFTINPRPITITADAKTKIYWAPDPVLTFQITAGTLLSGDTFSGELTREPGEYTGTYAILQGTVSLPDYYDLTYIGANFTITSTWILLPLIYR